MSSEITQTAMTIRVEGRRSKRLSNAQRIGIGCLFLPMLCMLCTLIFVIFPPTPVDILVMGLDSRGSEGNVARSDVIMLVGINPPNRSVSLLSIPRDLFIDVPGYGAQRINTINVLGELEEVGYGPQLLSDSIAQNFGIQTDRYVRVNFEAFVALVDAVGGVTIDVPRNIVDYSYPTADGGTMVVEFTQGTEHMDGERALIYSRTRHADDDYARAGRQQQVVEAVMRKLINPIYWIPAIGAISQNVETDVRPFDAFITIPAIILNGGVDTLVIDRDYISAGAGYSVPNYQKVGEWTANRFD